MSGEEKNPEGGKSGRPPPQRLRAIFGSQTRLPPGLQDCLVHTRSPHTPAPSRVHARPRGRTRPGVRPAPPGPPWPYLVGPFNPFHVREVDLGNRRSKRKLDLRPAALPEPGRLPLPSTEACLRPTLETQCPPSRRGTSPMVPTHLGQPDTDWTLATSSWVGDMEGPFCSDPPPSPS